MHASWLDFRIKQKQNVTHSINVNHSNTNTLFKKKSATKIKDTRYSNEQHAKISDKHIIIPAQGVRVQLAVACPGHDSSSLSPGRLAS